MRVTQKGKKPNGARRVSGKPAFWHFMKRDTVKTGFTKALIPSRLVACTTTLNGRLCYLAEFANSREKRLIFSSDANSLIPKLVISFLENR